MLPGKYLAGGLQSGCIADLIGVQYKLRFQKEAVSRVDEMKQYFSYFANILFMIKRVYALDKKAVWLKVPLKLTAIVQVFKTKFTDAVLALQDGHVAEYGTFDELINNPEGIFYNMYVLQQQHYKN